MSILTEQQVCDAGEARIDTLNHKFDRTGMALWFGVFVSIIFGHEVALILLLAIIVILWTYITVLIHFAKRQVRRDVYSARVNALIVRGQEDKD